FDDVWGQVLVISPIAEDAGAIAGEIDAPQGNTPGGAKFAFEYLAHILPKHAVSVTGRISRSASRREGKDVGGSVKAGVGLVGRGRVVLEGEMTVSWCPPRRRWLAKSGRLRRNAPRWAK